MQENQDCSECTSGCSDHSHNLVSSSSDAVMQAKHPWMFGFFKCLQQAIHMDSAVPPTFYSMFKMIAAITVVALILLITVIPCLVAELFFWFDDAVHRFVNRFKTVQTSSSSVLNSTQIKESVQPESDPTLQNKQATKQSRRRHRRQD